MPVFHLNKDIQFPPPTLAETEGLLAIGGDAHPSRLLLAYQSGIFPWPTEEYPLLWFSPDPRFVLDLKQIHLPSSLIKAIRKDNLTITADQNFETIIEQCANAKRNNQEGTWITDELIQGFIQLHKMGIAHSIEAWSNNKIVGGLYGVSLGRAFFGESMFAISPNASKIAFTTLLGNLLHWNFDFVDCQVHTEHLERFGASHLSRKHFLKKLQQTQKQETRFGPWTFDLNPIQSMELLKNTPIN